MEQAIKGAPSDNRKFQADDGIIERSTLDLPTAFSAPRTPTENSVAQIWRDAFDMDEVGIHDDFFDLGGDSLIASAIAAVISSDFETKFRPGMLMTYSTIALVAPLVEKSSDVNKEGKIPQDWPMHLVPVRSEGKLPPLFVIHGRFGITFPRKSFVDGFDAEQPLYFIQAIGYMGEADPPRTIEAIASKYLAAMRFAQPDGPLNIASFCTGGSIAVEVACQSAAAGDPLASVTLIDPMVPYALKRKTKPMWITMISYRVRIRWKKLRVFFGAVSDDNFLAKLERNKQRHPMAEQFDPAVVIRAQEQLEAAYIGYRPKAYSGRVDVLASERRTRRGGKQNPWIRVLSDMHVHVMGDTHKDVLKHNEGDVARQLQRIILGKYPA